jgi:predicted adenylyl cyclase CyaB
MPTETECKIAVADFKPIEARLEELRAEPHGEFLQDDRFFDTPQERLLGADQGLRLRSVVRKDQEGAATAHILTYKGARQPGLLKQREEIEAGVSDPQAMVDVLDRLGFTLMLRLQKRRKRYKLGGCWVELDTVPLLGRFVEVEGPDGEAIAQVAKGLGLDLSQSITDSYASLLMAQARKQGQATRPTEFLL